jgi:hypothetical protein
MSGSSGIAPRVLGTPHRAQQKFDKRFANSESADILAARRIPLIASVSRNCVFGSSILKLTALTLVAACASLAAIAIARYTAFLRQPQSWLFMAELAGILLLYAVAALTLAPLCLGARGPICRFGFVFGLITGSAEILNLVLENCLPSLARGAFSIAYMLVIFSLWGVAGAFATRRSKSIRVGTAIAATSAALCMLIATAAGFMIELFIRPPDISMVAVWPEFARSGWTDARAFALANTLDSGFTHLLFAPIVAVIFGFFASAMAKRKTQ